MILFLQCNLLTNCCCWYLILKGGPNLLAKWLHLETEAHFAFCQKRPLIKVSHFMKLLFFAAAAASTRLPSFYELTRLIYLCSCRTASHEFIFSKSLCRHAGTTANWILHSWDSHYHSVQSLYKMILAERPVVPWVLL